MNREKVNWIVVIVGFSAVALAVKAQLGESSDEDEGTETVTSCVKCNTNIPTGPGSEVQASKCIAKTIEERDSSYSCFTAQVYAIVLAFYSLVAANDRNT